LPDETGSLRIAVIVVFVVIFIFVVVLFFFFFFFFFRLFANADVGSDGAIRGIWGEIFWAHSAHVEIVHLSTDATGGPQPNPRSGVQTDRPCKLLRISFGG
jgi:hypothetical protein